MNSTNKFLALSLIVLTLSGFIVFSIDSVNVYAAPKPAPKPSVPQFTVKLVDNSYDVPPSTTTDPYTGVTTTEPGYHVNQRDIEVTIKKQPFTIYGEEGYIFRLRYYVEVKGHFGDEWTAYYDYVAHLNSDTVVTRSANDYAAGSQLDFRVKAIIRGTMEEGPFNMIAPAVDSESGWSKVQTITISSKPSSAPTQTITLSPPSTTSDDGNSYPQSSNQTQPSNVVFTNPFFLLGIGVLFGGVVVAVVMIILKKHLKTQTYPTNGLTQNSPHTEQSLSSDG
ncbi:MAG: hypothetical protein FWD52_03530 [Candidatus Bathyarchaeota archaeon]|nr:hypothetical protein [Candidatus Termiticorpusculum sp.]